MAHTHQFRQFIRLLQQARRKNLLANGAAFPPLTKEEARRRGLMPLSRRRLIKAVALATGSAIAATTLSRWQRVSSQEMPKIAIVGGGLAGLNAAYQLKKAGLTATVYEARNRLGGRIFSATGAVGEGLVMDLGGSFINSDHKDMLELVKEFDLKLFDRDVHNSNLPEVAYYFDGQFRSETEIAEQLSPLAAQISQDANLLDQDFDRFAPDFDRLSVSAYLDRHTDKIPTPLVRQLIKAAIRTEYGVEIDRSSALQLLFTLPTVEGETVDLLANTDEHFMLERGSSSLIDALGASLSGQIQMGMRLTEIVSKGSGFRLSFARKSPIDADWVILAVPFTVLRDVKIGVNLPAKLRRFIDEVSLGSNEKLIAGFNERVWQHSHGFAEEMWANLSFSEAWDETQRQIQQKAGAITFFFSAKEVESLQSGTATSQGKKILEEFEQAIAGAKRSANGKFVRTKWTKDPFTKGGYTNFEPGQLTEFSEFLYIESDNEEERQDVRVDKLIFAGEQVSDEFYGFMNGAAQTGRLAAEIIIRSVGV